MADMEDASKNQPAGYVPPKVWTWDAENGGAFASINRPISGATKELKLPRGEHPFQLYSMGTPNGVKVTIMLEELLEKGISEAEYDAWLINIGSGDQFGSDFVDINPNSKIPAMMDYSTDPAIRLFESGSMLVHLAEKFDAFWPTAQPARSETMNWLMWQMGSAPFVGGGFGHFYNYAPFKIEYAIDRYAMETKRQLHVLDTQLSKTEYVAGDEYTIADMAIFPWYGNMVKTAYNAQEFLSVHEYTNVLRWVDTVSARPGVKRGRMVNLTWGPAEKRMAERHSASDFENNTDAQVEARGGKRI